MHRIPVESSNIATIGFANGVLEIEFKSGSVYQYYNVPADVHSKIMLAESKGKYFNLHIKDVYDFAKI